MECTVCLINVDLIPFLYLNAQQFIDHWLPLLLKPVDDYVVLISALPLRYKYTQSKLSDCRSSAENERDVFSGL